MLLLEALWEPAAVAVMHSRGRQRADTPQAKGNCLADRGAKSSAQDNIATKFMVMPVVSRPLTAQAAPVYDEDKTTWARTEQDFSLVFCHTMSNSRLCIYKSRMYLAFLAFCAKNKGTLHLNI